MFEIKKDNSILITRGDSAFFIVDLVNSDGTKYIMTFGDKLKFTVKFSPTVEDNMIQKESETNSFKIEPNDTKELDFGIYVYDIELITSAGDVFTVVPINRIQICEEVG